MKIEVNNVDKVERFLINLPKKLDSQLTKTNRRFMSGVRTGARARATVDTGRLKQSIRLKPVKRGKNVKQWKLVVGSPYALFQEEGFTPHSFFAGSGFSSRKLIPNRVYLVSKWTPFVRPAVENQIKTYPKKLNNACKRAFGQ